MGKDIYQALTPDSDGGKHKRVPNTTVPIQTKEYATGAHLHMLLSVVDALCHNLRAPAFDSDGAPVVHRMDGGVKMAIESTVIRACNTLDKVVEDMSRWDVKEAKVAEKKVREIMQANVDFLRAQAKASAHITRPCVRFQPRLVRLTDGTYACYLGDIESGTAIVGQGANPEAALVAFDQVFNGMTPDEMKRWIRSKTSNEKQNEKRHLDTNSTGTPDCATGGRLDDTANCKRSGRRRIPSSKQTRPARKSGLLGPDGAPLNPS